MHPARKSLAFLSVAIVVLAAVLAVVLPVTMAPAAAASAAGTRVGASHPGMILAVRADHPVSAGEGRSGGLSQPGGAAGACVAPEDAGAGAGIAERLAASCGGASFTANTKVLLASGIAVPIAGLRPGDKVLATNTRTGKTSAEPVTAVLVHRDTNRYNLTVKTAYGTAVIHTTTTHLFWNPATRGWAKVAALGRGSHLRTPDGARATVVGGHAPKSRAGWMWDLTVASDHDFYTQAATTAILVHNCPVGPQIPTLKIDAARMPNIARNIYAAIVEEGQPDVLARETDSAAIRANRFAAQGNFSGPPSPDEYPFASSMQGGAGARVASVPQAEQNIQGGVMSNFYAKNGIGQGDLFRVVIDWGGLAW